MRGRAAAALVLLAVLAGVAQALELPPPVARRDLPPEGYACQAGLSRSLARLGGRVIYRGRVEVPPATELRWEPPRSEGALEWGAPRARRLPVLLQFPLNTLRCLSTGNVIFRPT